MTNPGSDARDAHSVLKFISDHIGSVLLGYFIVAVLASKHWVNTFGTDALNIPVLIALGLPLLAWLIFTLTLRVTLYLIASVEVGYLAHAYNLRWLQIVYAIALGVILISFIGQLVMAALTSNPPELGIGDND